jgi:hypothetical protein
VGRVRQGRAPTWSATALMMRSMTACERSANSGDARELLSSR